MIKFEYLVDSFHVEHRNIHGWLDSYGAKGWELVQVISSETFVFKRQILDKAKDE